MAGPGLLSVYGNVDLHQREESARPAMAISTRLAQNPIEMHSEGFDPDQKTSQADSNGAW